METEVGKLFERYERLAGQALRGEADPGELASLYALEFIASSPAGLMAGKNDSRFIQALVQGHAYYREIGTKSMRVREVRLSPIDGLHCVAHVAWTATYARRDEPDEAIDFEVHYFVRNVDGEAKVFGWVSGDEQALLREHGIV